MDVDNIACFRCGQVGHLRANCPQGAPLPPAAPQQAAPQYLDAGAYRRPVWEISEPTDEWLRAREQLSGGGMPWWLRKRMTAWQQVAASRRDPMNTCNRRVMADIRK